MNRPSPGSVLFPLLITAAALACHGSALGAPFHFDDYTYIVANRHLRSLEFPWSFMQGNTRPILFLTLALNRALGGLNPWGYHGVNLLILIASALTLYGIVRRTLLLAAGQNREAGAEASAASTVNEPAAALPASWLALLAALLWAVHPLQTNVVAYVWQRGESLMALFYLLTLYCFIRGTARAAGRHWFLAAGLCCGLGMATKEVMVTAPLLVLLYDRTFISGSFGRSLQRHGRVFAGLSATWGVLAALMVAATRTFHENPGVGFSSAIYSPGEYALTMPGVLAHYLRLAVWPSALCFDPNWPIARSLASAFPAALLIIPLLAATLLALVYRPRWGFPGAGFFLILAPTSSFMPMPDPMFEYRLHLPLAAVAALAVGGTYYLLNLTTWKPAAGKFALGLGLAVAVLLGILTHQRNQDFRSALALWGDTFRQRPDNLRAFRNLWLAVVNSGDPAAALAPYEKALQADPHRLDALLLLGYAARVRTRDLAAAGAYLALAVEEKPDCALAHFHLAVVLAARGRPDEARRHLEETLRLKPLHVPAHLAAGRLLEAKSRLPEAIRHYAAAVRIWPKHAGAHGSLAKALASRGRPEQALKHFRAAARLQPGSAAAQYALALAYRQSGDEDRAYSYFRQALRLQPNFGPAHLQLGLLLEKAGRTPEAAHHYAQAARFMPDNREARAALARLRQNSSSP